MLSEKLRFLLDILNTDNTEISRCAGCSASNISRLKSGSRIPQKNSRTIKKLSAGICYFARSSGTQELLSLVVGAEVTSDMDESVIDWLYDDAPPELPPPELEPPAPRGTAPPEPAPKILLKKETRDMFDLSWPETGALPGQETSP